MADEDVDEEYPNDGNLMAFRLVKPRSNSEGVTELEPDHRSGHRCAVSNSNLYSVGGYNPKYWGVDNNEHTVYPIFRELWKFNFSLREWCQVETRGRGYMPVELASPAALLVSHTLVVHGGTGTPFGHASSNDLHLCNLKTMNWSYRQCSGDLPRKVYGHSLTLIGRTIYMFGGTTGYEYSDEMHKLDLTTMAWKKIENGGNIEIPGRYRHEAATDGKRIYILGGGRSYATYGFSFVHAFDVERDKWELLQCHGDKGFPAARRCHSCVTYKNDVYICGGYNGEVAFADLWKLNLSTLQWTKMCDLPKPTYFHSADVTMEGCMYIFGGVNVIDNKRNSDIYQIWLTTPSLKEFCWMTICDQVKNLKHTPTDTLLELGIPENYISRIKGW